MSKSACKFLFILLIAISFCLKPAKTNCQVHPVKKAFAKPPIDVKKNIFIKKINGYDLVYDCYNCHPENAITDSIVVYAQKGGLRIKLLCDIVEDNYIDDVTIVYFLKHPFLYVTVSHPHGHFYGTLYAVDMIHFKSMQVLELKGHFKTKIPKNLESRNWNGIRIEKGEILDGGYYRDSLGRNYSIDRKYKMIQIVDNEYALKPIKETIDGEQ